MAIAIINCHIIIFFFWFKAILSFSFSIFKYLKDTHTHSHAHTHRHSRSHTEHTQTLKTLRDREREREREAQHSIGIQQNIINRDNHIIASTLLSYVIYYSHSIVLYWILFIILSFHSHKSNPIKKPRKPNQSGNFISLQNPFILS